MNTLQGIDNPYYSVPYDHRETEEYKYVLGNENRKVGDRIVTPSMYRITDPGYKNFERVSDTYLSVTSMNLLFLTAVLTVFTHFGVVVSKQGGFKYGTFSDLLNGPILIIILAGLTGMGIVLGNYGVADEMYYSLYLPFGVIVIGIALWSMVNVSSVDSFRVESISDFVSFSFDSVIWLCLIGAAMTAATSNWTTGGARIDSMGLYSSSTLIFIVMVVLFAYGLSKLFALTINTLDYFEIGRENGGKESLEFGMVYFAAVLITVVVLMSANKFLDTAINIYSGHYNTVFAPSAGVGAARATLETQRVYKLALYTVIFVSAALMWRRKTGLAPLTSGANIKKEWTSLASMLILIPVVAVLSETIKGKLLITSPVYDLLRTLLLSLALVYIGTGYLPWNYGSLAFIGSLSVMFFMGYQSTTREWNKPVSAFLAAALFTWGKLSYRAGEIWFEENSYSGGHSTKSTSVWLWVVNVIFPAVLCAFVFNMSNELLLRGGHSYFVQMFNLYAVFTVFYTFSLNFVDTSAELPVTDSPNYDLIPDKEAASLAIDGIILMATLMMTLATWNVVSPKGRVSGGALIGGDIDITFKEHQLLKLSMLDIAGYVFMGIGAVVMYINIRHDHQLSRFAQESQRETDEWYVNSLKDVSSSQ